MSLLIPPKPVVGRNSNFKELFHNSSALPRMPFHVRKTTVEKIVSFVGNFFLNVTLICPVIQLIHSFYNIIKLRSVARYIRTSSSQELLNNKINRLVESKNIKTKFIPNIAPFFTPFALVGDALLSLPAEELITADLLPPSLDIEKVKKGQHSKKEWVIEFFTWVEKHPELKSYLPQQPATSQYSCDVLIEEALLWLEQLLDPNKKELFFAAKILHEVGHSRFLHTTKKILIHFLIQMTTLFTLGITLILKKNIKQLFDLKFEKEADLFSAKLGQKRGLKRYFLSKAEANKELHKKFPEIYDRFGNFLRDKSHPPLRQRIKYLS